MKTGWAYLLVIGVLVILGLGVYGTVTAVRTAASPFQSLSESVGTQVAQILRPTPTIRPDPVAIVREVRALARLETIQYTIERVITAETGQGPFGFLFGDRLILVAHGIVIAGVDLSRIQPSDVQFDDLGRVYLALPEPEVFVATLDNDKSYVYDRETGLLTRGSVQLEAEARRAAEAAIRDTALEDGILDQARVNAESYLYGLLRTLGYVDVVFQPARSLPTPTLTPVPLASPTP
ncbi:MAG TPA: DUF4230 domain-containing protein [Anaerolineales bacterium]|nr:DUF4230 domain-containing protein [Anaerolineales bacterium]